jgi:hypothetical protein
MKILLAWLLCLPIFTHTFELVRTAFKHHKTFLLHRSKPHVKSSVAALCTNKKISLHEAVKKDLKDVAVQLLKNGASVNACEPEAHRTPLHYVTSKSMAQLLIAYGANVNAQDSNGDTPLHTTNVDAIPVLLANGADISIKNKESITFRLYYHHASRSNEGITKQRKIITIFKKYNVEHTFLLDLEEDEYGIIRNFALKHDGKTPLMESFSSRNHASRFQLRPHCNKFKTLMEHSHPNALYSELKPIKAIIEFYKICHPEFFTPNLNNIERVYIDNLIKEFDQKHSVKK